MEIRIKEGAILKIEDFDGKEFVASSSFMAKEIREFVFEDEVYYVCQADNPLFVGKEKIGTACFMVKSGDVEVMW